MTDITQNQTFERKPMPDSMKKVFSIGGRTFSEENGMSWCLPGEESLDMPICVLVMTSGGPRFFQTLVKVPDGIDRPRGHYREIKPSRTDYDVMEGIFNWETDGVSDDDVEGISQAMELANSFGAANRFLPIDPVAFHKALNPVSIGDLFFGQNVRVHVTGEVAPVDGRLVAYSDPIVVISKEGQIFRKFVVPEDCLFV
jgi:hypothetical protein